MKKLKLNRKLVSNETAEAHSYNIAVIIAAALRRNESFFDTTEACVAIGLYLQSSNAPVLPFEDDPTPASDA